LKELPRAGLNKEYIIDQAMEMVEQDGSSAFSLHLLAARLGVKTPSLYKHIKMPMRS